jgi:hypothetical protein
MKTYYIYHIPNFVRNDGSLGKIGCTALSIQERAAQQGYDEVELLEEHTDIELASTREIELQLQYFGKRDNNVPYSNSYNHRRKWTIADSSKGANGLTYEQRSKGGTNSSGKIKKGQSIGTFETRSKGGINSTNIEHTCPHCGKQSKGPSMKRWHFDNCKHKHTE